MLMRKRMKSSEPFFKLRLFTGFALGGLVLITTSYARPSSQTSPSAQADQESVFSRIVPDDCHAPSESAMSDVNLALAAFERNHNLQNEVRALVLLGSLYERSGEYKQALPSLQRALPLTKDGRVEAQLLTITADALTQVGQSDAALHDATEALSISTKLGDVAAEASAVRAQGEAVYLESKEKALQYFQKALLLSQQAGDLKSQAILLNDEGAALQDSGSPFDIFHQALSIEDRIGDCRDKEDTLTNLATLERDRGQIRNALEHFNDAIALEGQVGDRTSQAQTLHQLGDFHWEIGDLGQALTLFNQALQIKKQVGDVDSAAETLGAIAGVDRDAKLPSAALRAYLQVLPTVERAKDAPWRVMILNNLGTVEADLHNKVEARAYYNKSAQLALSSGDQVTPAFTAWGIGELEQADALLNYFQSVRLAREFEQSDLEGEVDSSLMDHFRARHQPNVAIFFGKRAIDQFQALRRSMGTMSNDLTSSFLQRKSSTYRVIAEILIDQRRLIEAQQVLDLLKIQQYSDYVGEQPSTLSQGLPRSPREAPLEQQFEVQLKRLVDLDKALRTDENAKPRQTQVILRARAALRTAEAGCNSFLQTLNRQLESKEGPAAGVETVTGVQLPLQKLIDANPHLAALYTLESADRYLVIAITHAGRLSRSFGISQANLDTKCQQFLDLIKDPGNDPIQPSQDLFAIILGPVQKDLQAAGASTLLWSLDGSLRFIPIAALQDGQTHRYLIEDYVNVNLSPISRSLESTPRFEGATAIGLGDSRVTLDGLRTLPSVPAELNSVVADPDVPGSHGVLPGKILLNSQFTEKAMEKALQSQAVVHIATHFVLQPGNDDLSYLLLGGKDQDSAGYRYSMAEFAKSNDLHIDGTKLLTLSACETAAENKRNVCFEQNKSSVIVAKCDDEKSNQREDGVVMEGMSELVLQKGAESVLSSLWSVNDTSTSQIMADFYRRWVGSGGKLTKAEALRKAELDLLHGRVAPQSGTNNRGVIAVDEDAPDQSGLPIYAHPYYWAPFVLTGNWQ